MKPQFTTAAGIVVAAVILASAFLLTQPRYTVVEVQQSFNNGFGVWRLDTLKGTMSLCSATPGGLICSNPAIELGEQDQDIAQASVAVSPEAPAEAPAE